jgi:hypothetical protein
MEGVKSWWYGTSNNTNSANVTSAVMDTGVTLQELEIKQRQLQRRAEKVQQEALAADEQGDEITRDARVSDWNALQADIEHYGVLIENTRATRTTLDSVAANVSVFQTQRQAVTALETVNKQISVADVDRTHEQLERNMDTSHEFSRVMATRLRKPTRTNGSGKLHGKEQAAVQDTLAKWKTHKIPAEIQIFSSTGAAASAAAPVSVQKGKEEEEGK